MAFLNAAIFSSLLAKASSQVETNSKDSLVTERQASVLPPKYFLVDADSNLICDFPRPWYCQTLISKELTVSLKILIALSVAAWIFGETSNLSSSTSAVVLMCFGALIFASSLTIQSFMRRVGVPSIFECSPKNPELPFLDTKNWTGLSNHLFDPFPCHAFLDFSSIVTGRSSSRQRTNEADWMSRNDCLLIGFFINSW
ncbi:hypothetical protein OGAPHI_001767 [Ogataea philodendri]|uniref:Uncharacterized protein n=1 Tax=Ogataea philodendri TaxID=1378263 RepID=A0A9P8T6E5_9ASCO|nr:uncharacterized protein OGAPHI_001767 [Ogataea philodendri]KAH3668013.1 hypothetical protein OGAPHI_001767 [Ogataea philodendri]